MPLGRERERDSGGNTQYLNYETKRWTRNYYKNYDLVYYHKKVNFL